MAFPTNPSPGDTYTDAYGTVWVYAGTVNGWYRQSVSTPNDTSYTAAISGPAGSNTQVQFNDNGELAGDGGLTYNKTTDALSGGAFIPTGSTVPTNGVYLPSANNVAISTNGTGRLFVDASGNVGLGTSAPDANSILDARGLIYAGNGTIVNQIGFSVGNSTAVLGARSNHGVEFRTNNTERLRITSAGLVGIGSSTPGSYDGNSNNLVIANTGGNAGMSIVTSSTGDGTISWADGTTGNERYRGFIGYSHGADRLLFGTAATNALAIDSSQRVGIGTTSPSSILHCSSLDAVLTLQGTRGTGASATIGTGGANSQNLVIAAGTDLYQRGAIHLFQNVAGTTEYGRWDSSGRLLVGTSTARGGFDNNSGVSSNLQVEGAGTAAGGTRTALSIVNNGSADADSAGLYLARSGGTAVGSFTAVTADDILGRITFSGADGSEFVQGASIEAAIDGTPGANDMPGRLVFRVTANGASSPTEALRISNDRSITVSDGGNIVVGTTTGTKIGTATSQKIGFFDATPVVQPTTGVAEAAFVENSGGTAVNVDSTFGGYTLQQVVQALQNLGILA